MICDFFSNIIPTDLIFVKRNNNNKIVLNQTIRLIVTKKKNESKLWFRLFLFVIFVFIVVNKLIITNTNYVL